MKKVIKLFLSGIILSSALLSSVNTFASTEKIMSFQIGEARVYTGGKYEPLDVAPYIQESTNSTMIPLRYVSTALNISENNVIFNQATKTVTIINSNDTLEFYVNSNSYKKNGITFTGNSIVEIKDGRTFVPLRSLAEAFDLYIEWNNYSKSAIVVANIDKTPQSNTNQTQVSNSNLQTTTSTSTTLTEQEIRAMEEEVVRLVNEERAKYGLQPLQISETLMQSARAKSEDMATRNYSSHTDPNGYTMYKELNVGENIAYGFNKSYNAINWWLNSEGHRANILNPNYKYIGVGFAKNSTSEYTYYWTQHFSY